MSTRLLTITLAAALFTPAAPAALAQNCEAPPGSAAVDQYCEAIPEGGGSQSGNDFQRSAAGSAAEGTGGASSPLSAAALRALRAAGAEGAAVEELARTSRATRGGGSAAAGDVAGVSAASDDVSGSPLNAVSASVENGPVAGPLLIWALLGATLALIGLAWVPYRRRNGEPRD